MPGTEERVRYDLMVPRAPEGPVDLRALFPGEGFDIELDVGFGRGASIFNRVEVAPTSRLLGVEVKTKCVYAVEERRKRLGLERVVVYATDIRTLLPRLGPDGTLARVFVHFPDPWWKKRHQHRRVLGDAVLVELARLLRPGGEVFVQTDVEDRAFLYRDLLAAQPEFVLATDSGFVDRNPFGARSNRERRAEEDGLPIHRVLAFRRGLAAHALAGRCGG